jgi:hypothetical protein
MSESDVSSKTGGSGGPSSARQKGRETIVYIYSQTEW